MITRSIWQRRLLLRPSPRINQIVRYVLAVMADKWNIHLHASTVMGNHWHACVSDPDGNIVEFERDVHHFITCAVNAAHNESGAIWDRSQSSRVQCLDGEALVGRIAYVMANPVEARLVAHGKNWPGVRHAWPRKPMVIKRPRWFFRGKKWPATATLEFKRPPGYVDLSDDELAAVVQSAIEEREENQRKKARANGESFLGRKGVLRQRRHDRPKSPRKPGVKRTVAGGSKWRREEREQSDRDWVESYNQRFDRWRAGDRDVVFPYGTYKMRVIHHARCDPGPD